MVSKVLNSALSKADIEQWLSDNNIQYIYDSLELLLEIAWYVRYT